MARSGTSPSSEQGHWHLTWIGGGSFLARRLARPVARFIQLEAAAGILMVIATVAALIWVNVSTASYSGFWSTEVHLAIGGLTLDLTLQEWIDEGLMALFFFVVGMEIKREVVSGELRDPRAAALPVIAAIGGMVVPAALYFALNAGGPGEHGWGIPMATDIAFAVGVVSLLGNRVPVSLKLFLLTLAVVDDIGGIIVIAIWYSQGVQFLWLVAAAGVFGFTYLIRRLRVWYLPIYVVLGAGAWYLMLRSGVHAAIAGVVVGMLTPARPLNTDLDPEAIADSLGDVPDLEASDVRVASKLIKDAVPISERLTDVLHPWTAMVIVPVFALANAAIPLGGGALREALRSRVTLGVLVGLVVGKTLGITLLTFLAMRLGWGTRPKGASNMQIWGIAMIAGIGLTVSLFITGVSFDDPALQDQAKVGILVASVIASLVGTTVLASAARSVSAAELASEAAAEEALFELE